eukprot:892998-Prymnesium_polylepis.1
MSIAGEHEPQHLRAPVAGSHVECTKPVKPGPSVEVGAKLDQLCSSRIFALDQSQMKSLGVSTCRFGGHTTRSPGVPAFGAQPGPCA